MHLSSTRMAYIFVNWKVWFSSSLTRKFITSWSIVWSFNCIPVNGSRVVVVTELLRYCISAKLSCIINQMVVVSPQFWEIAEQWLNGKSKSLPEKLEKWETEESKSIRKGWYNCGRENKCKNDWYKDGYEVENRKKPTKIRVVNDSITDSYKHTINIILQ